MDEMMTDEEFDATWAKYEAKFGKVQNLGWQWDMTVIAFMEEIHARLKRAIKTNSQILDWMALENEMHQPKAQ